MQQHEQLRQAVAEFLEMDVQSLHTDFPLAGPSLASSLGRATLEAAIVRRVGIKAPAVYSAKTYGQLEAATLGSTTDDGRPAASGPLNSPTLEIAQQPASIACGVDIERVEDLPAATDYWEHEFYRAQFSKAEIAYCLTQPRPREHFAARWCAKEALKKCDGQFLQESPAHLEVVVDAAGAPSLWYCADGERRRLPYAVSLSHTREVAIAVVVGTATAQTPPAERLDPTSNVPQATRDESQQTAIDQDSNAAPRRTQWLAVLRLLIDLVILLLVIWVLWRTW